jgi:periplasmic divalent cation tolerance protein
VTEDVCAVVITAPDADWLAAFVRSLVERRLCASGHLVSPIRSIYRWQDNVEDRAEAHATLHTRLSLVATIVQETNERHPYVVPGVMATPIVEANPAYRQWILDQTVQPAGDQP